MLDCRAQSKVDLKKDVYVVLLGGQSNMVGFGNYDQLDDRTKARIEAISNRVALSHYKGDKASPLSYTKIKLHEKYNLTKRFGPELFLGLTLAENNPNQEFLLIKTAQGGTALYGAWNPNWSAKQAKEIERGEQKQNMKLYENHINQIKAQLARLKAEGKSYKIIGMAWMQGENDAKFEASASNYGKNLGVLLSSYRKEFNIPNMPFVAGQTNSHYGMKGGSDMVRQGFLDFEKSEDNVVVIKTVRDSPYTDFPKHPDNVHYNTEGQKNLGTAFGNALIQLNSK
ncbi:hypothetical protein AXE80_02875 [Wenyingzhuangia fucanilytica]|uniref:Sialate O-acetylesterase domain-containing protein n=1 Tax=Wenyingzhuangia fucanilytica TaxID=1790137 RepID=A0A1B1Y3F5_9FLAO|nr:hypothetical protein AXE80_02875 [Wenyingzhuangia fucanilytica]